MASFEDTYWAYRHRINFTRDCLKHTGDDYGWRLSLRQQIDDAEKKLLDLLWNYFIDTEVVEP